MYSQHNRLTRLMARWWTTTTYQTSNASNTYRTVSRQTKLRSLQQKTIHTSISNTHKLLTTQNSLIEILSTTPKCDPHTQSRSTIPTFIPIRLYFVYTPDITLLSIKHITQKKWIFKHIFTKYTYSRINKNTIKPSSDTAVHNTTSANDDTSHSTYIMRPIAEKLSK